jgi:predicted DNA-binding transcriptional regulator YafY
LSRETIRTDEEKTRTARILDMIQCIALQPRRWLRRDLALHYEVSERQIDKDLQIIRHGLRLSLRHSPDGYFFETMPQLPAVSYTFSEALALLLAARATQVIPGVASADLAAAIARLEAIFPSEFVALLHQTVHQTQHFKADSPRQEKLQLLYEAMALRRKVWMRYAVGYRDGEITERVIRPYYLLPYVRSWQVIAYCELRQSERMFKVDRVLEGRLLLNESYEIPDEFDLDEYMGQGWGLMRGSAGEPEPIILRFSPEVGRGVAEETWHSSQDTEELADGRWEMRLEVGITPEFVRWLLYYGDQVEIVEPHHLRVRVAEEHRRAGEKWAEE